MVTILQVIASCVFALVGVLLALPSAIVFGVAYLCIPRRMRSRAWAARRRGLGDGDLETLDRWIASGITVRPETDPDTPEIDVSDPKWRMNN